MSNTRSDSSESISIYETPINSPSNQSLIDSTRIDSSLFGNTSVNTQSVDVLDFRQSLESMPTSPATDSTLRQTVERLNTECIETNRHLTQSIDVSTVGMSFAPFSRQTITQLRSHSFDSNSNELNVMLMKYMSDLECEQLELLGVEQQIQSLCIKCRTIRENMISKTNLINSVINEMLSKKKQTVQRQTQTDFEDNHSSDLPSSDGYKSFSNSSRSRPLNMNSRVSVLSQSITKFSPKTNSPKNDFQELSVDMKNQLSRLPAMVKGYLTRRLMKTETVLNKIATIRDTTQLLSNYRNTPSNKKITPEDIKFHKRLIIQLEKSCHELYDIFFNYSKSSQMALISRSREYILERYFRTASVLSNSSYLNSSFTPNSSQLSSVTKKVIQRKSQKIITKAMVSESSRIPTQNNSPKSVPLGQSMVKVSNNRINPSVRRSQRNTATNVSQTHKRKANFDNK